MEDACSDIESQNILAKLLRKSSLTRHREIKSSLGKRSYVVCCSRKETSGIAWLLKGVWQLKEVRRNTDERRCCLCVGEEDVKCVTG